MGKHKAAQAGATAGSAAGGSPFPLVDRVQLALAMDWNITTISLMQAREGLPVEVPGAPGKPTLYSLPKVIAWRIEREIKRRLPDRPEGSGPTLDLDSERAQLAQAQRRRTELEIKAREGELLPRAEVRRVWSQRVAAVRARLIMLAPTATQQGVVPPANEAALQDLVEAAMRDLAGEGARKETP